MFGGYDVTINWQRCFSPTLGQHFCVLESSSEITLRFSFSTVVFPWCFMGPFDSISQLEQGKITVPLACSVSRWCCKWAASNLTCLKSHLVWGHREIERDGPRMAWCHRCEFVLWTHPCQFYCFRIRCRVANVNVILWGLGRVLQLLIRQSC